MRPTRYGVLGALALLAAAATWSVLHVVDARSPFLPFLPSLPWTVPVALVFLAGGIAASALNLRKRLRGDVDSRPVDLLAAARMAALAKASSHAGAVLAGIYLGMAAFFAPSAAGDLRRGRLLLAGFSVLGALTLVAAGLLLESVCRVRSPEDDPPDDE